ncbi:MAG: hypothetical protein M3N14_01565 [Bacteroidota bacterium]|nr:hypothetical protein [Bacteroidota bacterium]
MRTLKLIARFYNGIFLANFLVTLSCVYLLGNYGSHAHKIITVLFWYKMISVQLVFSTAIYYSRNELYYYQNLGVSKLQMGVTVTIVDFLIWLGLIIWQLSAGIPGYAFQLILWSVLLIYLYAYARK